MKEENKNDKKMFTQEEVNGIVQERLERERARYNKDADNLVALQEEVTRLRADLETANADRLEQRKKHTLAKGKADLLQGLEKRRCMDAPFMAELLHNCMSVDDEGELVITRGDKQVTLDELLDDVMGRAWLVRDTQKPGSGVSGRPLGNTQSVDPVRKIFVREGEK
ncbi:hypothetical protein [uncultured Veillonella sp.]|uniref:hypothetical protein n=1 Tax=uncultured Veillonella sp. TaxID=159268 RepID=UPI00259ABFAA|nr:hypothetical protein [uncultured Veillonella sp.]